MKVCSRGVKQSGGAPQGANQQQQFCGNPCIRTDVDIIYVNSCLNIAIMHLEITHGFHRSLNFSDYVFGKMFGSTHD